ncbi:hypothetical protein [Jatrophihabitans sp. GAS493]|uniref:hypothetical protein n=1 Tax=Jatrophihabitans sp. GAS493 TaxID=1907575 RepID=UPI0012FE7451
MRRGGRRGAGGLQLGSTATVIDLATRMVLGWQLAPHMRTSLIVDAQDMAITSGPGQARWGVPLR